MEEFLHKLLKLPAEFELRLERAHRSLQRKHTDPAASPRSFVLKFNSFKTKQFILQKAWREKYLTYKGEHITMNHDYATSLQRKRREYADIKKQLKAKQIKFQSPYPTMLKVFTNGETLTFNTAWEAAAPSGNQHSAIRRGASGERPAPLGIDCVWHEELPCTGGS